MHVPPVSLKKKMPLRTTCGYFVIEHWLREVIAITCMVTIASKKLTIVAPSNDRLLQPACRRHIFIQVIIC